METINIHKAKYNYMHIRLVQIAIKPLTRIGLNTFAFAYLRNKRHETFKDSHIEMVEASLNDDHAFSNCFPNFLSHDLGAYEATALGIFTKEFNMKPQSQNIAIVNRIYYDVMNTIVPDIAYSLPLKRVSTLFLTKFKNKVTTQRSNAGKMED